MEEIRLEYNPNERSERLVGLENDVEIDERIIAAVALTRRLFAPVVTRVAINQYKQEHPDYQHLTSEPPNSEILKTMGLLRDQLYEAITSDTERSDKIKTL